MTVFSWIGWALLAGGFFLALRVDEARREWIRVEGTIIVFSQDDDDATQAPIVEYKAPSLCDASGMAYGFA